MAAKPNTLALWLFTEKVLPAAVGSEEPLGPFKREVAGPQTVFQKVHKGSLGRMHLRHGPDGGGPVECDEFSAATATWTFG